MPTRRTDTQAASLYDRFVFPEPIADLDAFSEAGGNILGDPSTQFFNVWPERERFAPRILVPGCGTYMAAALAIRNPQSEVVGIDLSKECLAQNRKLKVKHDLSNLVLKRLDLRDVADLNASFDYILLTGVIHHLPDPAEGLKQLATVLSEDGVIAVLNYAQNVRAGIHMLRNAFRLTGLTASKADIALVRQALDQVGSSHPAYNVIRNLPELQTDGGIFHNLLTPEDRAFTVEEMFDLLDSAGLSFQDWFDRGEYHPVALGQQHPLYSRIAELEPRKQAIVVDNLTGRNGTHKLYARGRDSALPPVIDWSKKSTLQMVPHLQPNLQFQREQTAQGERISMKRAGRTQYPNNMLLAFVQSVNGERTMAECLNHLARNGATLNDDSEEATLQAFQNLYFLGHIMIQRAPNAAD